MRRRFAEGWLGDEGMANRLEKTCGDGRGVGTDCETEQIGALEWVVTEWVVTRGFGAEEWLEAEERKCEGEWGGEDKRL